jgi:hypothetical protein
MTAAEAIRQLARPADAARGIAALNDRLARARNIPPELVGPVREIAEGVTQTDLQRWEQIDPHLALIIHRAAMEAESALRSPDAPGARDALRLALDRLRQGFGAIAENEPVADGRPLKEVVRWLVQTTDVSQARLAELTGVGLRRFQRWLSEQEASAPEGDDARRVLAIARLVNQLRFALTGPGAVEWFSWPRQDLGGRRPIDLMADPASLPRLMAMAGRMRSTSAG